MRSVQTHKCNVSTMQDYCMLNLVVSKVTARFQNDNGPTVHVSPHGVRFEFLHAVSKNIAVLGDLTLWRLVQMFFDVQVTVHRDKFL